MAGEPLTSPSSRSRAGSWPAYPAPAGPTGCCRSSGKCWSPRSSASTKRRGSTWFASRSKSEFPPPAPWYDVSAAGLDRLARRASGKWKSFTIFTRALGWPRKVVRGLPRRRLPTVERWRLLFTAVPIAWDRWVEVWNAGHGRPRPSARGDCPRAQCCRCSKGSKNATKRNAWALVLVVLLGSPASYAVCSAAEPKPIWLAVTEAELSASLRPLAEKRRNEGFEVVMSNQKRGGGAGGAAAAAGLSVAGGPRRLGPKRLASARKGA